MEPYVYVSTGKSRDVSRSAPTGVRVAVHYPELGHCVELQTDAHGRFTVAVGPSAAESGEVHHGSVSEPA